MFNKAFPIRRQNYKFNKDFIPKQWYGNNIVLTAMWNALSITFPEGESFFVRSVKSYQKEIKDDYLREQVKAFIGQEAAHGKNHRSFNNMLKEQGFNNVDDLEKEVKTLLAFGRKALPKNVQLAITCALEHFTAILAEQLIDNKEHQRQIHGSLKELWLWHACEESEHKHVAYDVYEQINGSYAVRVGAMIFATVMLVAVIGNFQWRLLKQQNEQYNEEEWKSAMNYLLFDPGLFVSLASDYLEYYKPNFHPNKLDKAHVMNTRDALLKILT